MKKHTFTKTVVVLISNFIMLSTFAVAGVIHVPQDQPTIQEGINASAKGDTVLVAENTYYENISFVGKAITVASHFIVDGDTNHINNTIIDGSRPSNPDIGSVVSFVTPGEDTTSVLMGFTITGGTGTSVSGGGYTDKNGGGILVRYPGAKIVKNKIIKNHITTDGDIYAGGAAIAATNAFGSLVIRDNIICDNSATTTGSAQSYATVGVNTKNLCIVENNRIYNNVLNAPNASGFAAGLLVDGWKNKAGAYIIRNNIIHNNKIDSEKGGGGGVVIQNCSPLFYNNIVSENKAASWGGGGIWITHYRVDNDVVAPKPRIFNNTIINNSTTGSGGGVLLGSSSDSYAYLLNNIVWGNSAEQNAQIGKYNGAVIKVCYSIVQGNYSGARNSSQDPLLEADSLGNASPAIGIGTLEYDFGDSVVLQCPSFDIHGRARPFPLGSTPDIGAWESTLNSPATGIDPETVAEIPGRFALYPNYPNPFNPTTIIKYTVPSTAQSQIVRLMVYDLLGRKVATLVDEKQKPGAYQVEFDAGKLPSGIYIYKLETGAFKASRKMMLLQ